MAAVTTTHNHHNHEEDSVSITATVNISREDILAAINANKPAPRPMTTTEQSAAAGSKFARPDFRRQQAAAQTSTHEPAWRREPITHAQVEGIRGRLAARKGIAAAEAIRAEINALTDQGKEIGKLTKGQGSDYITQLDAIKPNPVENEAQVTPATQTDAWKRPNCVPDGEYALVQDGVVKFYTVQTPDKGNYAGICFVSVHASDERYNLKGRTRHEVLDAIAADPRAAAIRYGQETNHCSRCGRELTDEASRAAGIGPVCARKVGW